MRRIASAVAIVVAFVVLAEFVKGRIINAGDYLVRQPLLAVASQLAQLKSASVRHEPPSPQSLVLPSPPAGVSVDETKPVRSSWKLVTDHAPFMSRDGAGAVSFRGYIWLVNGYNPNGLPNSIYRSRDGKEWELVVEVAPWPRRHLGGFVVLNDRMFMLGGDFHTDVWSSADGINWDREHDVPWGKRYNPYIGVYDGKIWMMGGQTFDGPDGQSCEKPYCLSHAWNDVWSSVDGKSWTLVTAKAAWEPRSLISGFVVHDGAMWIVGGGIREIVPFSPHGPLADTRIDYADVWRSTDGIIWQNVTYKAGWAARTHHTVIGFDDHIILVGGSAGKQDNLQSDIWASRNGESWMQIGNRGEIPKRHAASMVAHNGELYLIAGLLHNDVWKLDRKVLNSED